MKINPHKDVRSVSESFRRDPTVRQRDVSAISSSSHAERVSGLQKAGECHEPFGRVPSIDFTT
jgi:hypothetical protein